MFHVGRHGILDGLAGSTANLFYTKEYGVRVLHLLLMDCFLNVVPFDTWDL
jgi:hypothetical protein